MNFLFICLKRGGQHGVINWLAQQTDEEVLHYNNCINGWEQKKFLPMKQHMCVHYDNEEEEITNFFFDHKIDLNKSEALKHKFHSTDLSGVDMEIYNIEDLSLKQFEQYGMKDFPQLKGGKAILLLRDPYNFAASCLQRAVDPPDAGATDVADQIEERMQVWKEHAREFIKFTEGKSDIYCINFNKWFGLPEYRKQICEDLGLEFTDRGLKKVMNFGSGSSFERQKFDGDAQKMPVTMRYKKFLNDERFLKLMDKEVQALAERIFAMNPMGGL